MLYQKKGTVVLCGYAGCFVLKCDFQIIEKGKLPKAKCYVVYISESESTHFPRMMNHHNVIMILVLDIRNTGINVFYVMQPNKFEMNNGTEQKCALKEKVQRWFLIATAVCAVIEILVLLGLTVHWRAVRENLVKSQQLHISLPSDKLITEKKGETRKKCPVTLKERIENQTNLTLCYGPFSYVMDEILSKGVVERYDSNTNPEMASLNLTAYGCERSQKQHPTLKLVECVTDKTDVQIGVHSKLFWKSQTPSYTKSCLTYLQDDGTIYVEKTGLYFVSLQLKTKWITASSENDTEKIIKHSVHQISNGTDAVIVENARTVCETLTDDAESTSVLGSIFKLEYGDRLYAATSHPQNIASDMHDNYFSVYSI